MKKISIFFLTLTFFSCATIAKSPTIERSNSLFEVLTQQQDGGASIRFFEILSEPDEIAMLQNDEILKHKVHSTDMQTANFIVCNLGEKTSAGYKIEVESVVETQKNIIVTIKEISPENNLVISQEKTRPYAIIKINSKKEIIIK